MARKPRELCESRIYHVTLRGINKQVVFLSDEDYDRFLSTVDRFCRRYRVEMYAYCLMSNHVHLLLKEGTESLWMTIKRITISYLMWYNSKYERIGPLFQGRFHSEAIRDDRQMMAAVRYIHRNPISANICSDFSYPWCSYNCYLGNRGIVDVDFFKSIVGEKDYISYQMTKDPIDDIGEFKGFESDRQVVDFLIRVTGVGNIHEIARLNKSERKAMVEQARDNGIGMTQLSRLTGITRQSLYYALNYQPPVEQPDDF